MLIARPYLTMSVTQILLHSQHGLCSLGRNRSLHHQPGVVENTDLWAFWSLSSYLLFILKCSQAIEQDLHPIPMWMVSAPLKDLDPSRKVQLLRVLLPPILVELSEGLRDRVHSDNSTLCKRTTSAHSLLLPHTDTVILGKVDTSGPHFSRWGDGENMHT